MTTAPTTDPIILPDLDRFLAALHQREASPHTLAAYCRDLTAFVSWFADHLDQDCIVTAVSRTGSRSPGSGAG